MAEANNDQAAAPAAEAAPAAAAEAPSAAQAPVAIPQPMEDPMGYLKYLSKNATKKVSYYVLDWIYKATGKEGEVPGAKKQQVSQKEFMASLKDGTLLAQLANKLSPGAVETVHEAPQEVEKQTENLENFSKFLKDKAGVAEEQLPKAEDVQKGGASGFNGLLGSLVQLGSNAKDKFAQDGLSGEQLTALATQVLGDNFVQKLLGQFRNLFHRNSQATVTDSAKAPAQQAEATPDKAPLPKAADDDIPAADATAADA